MAAAAAAAGPAAAAEEWEPSVTIFRTASMEKKTSQVFSTEFISAMHVAESESLPGAKEISDPWKQKYNLPIQVSSGSESVARHSGSVTAIEPYYERSTFKRSATYYKELTPEWDFAQVRYRPDAQDLEWAQLAHAAHPTVGLGTEAVATLITDFEKQCHRGITRAFSDEVVTQALNRVCDVCLLHDSEEANEMVFCEACDGLVHQQCYGITTIPEGDWFCQSCKVGVKGKDGKVDKSEQPECALCPNRGGMFKRTVAGDEWCHVQCAMWIPEAGFTDGVKMEPVELASVPPQRQKLHCYLCKIKSGACIQCNVPTCTTAFHVSCAVFNGLRLELVSTEKGTLSRNAYCVKHQNYKGDVHRGAIRHVVNGPGKAVPEVHSLSTTEFCEFVDRGAVQPPGPKAGKPSAELIEHVYAYWVQKRRAVGGRPLIRELAFTRNEIDRGIHRPDSQTEARSLVTLRGSLDSARTLSRLTHLREKKKLELFDLMQSEFTQAAKTFAESLDIDLGELSWGTEEAGGNGDADDGDTDTTRARKRLRQSKR